MNNEEENPTAAILLRFARKPNVDVSEIKHKQSKARHDISSQARTLTDAVRKEDKKAKQLESARKARAKKGDE